MKLIKLFGDYFLGRTIRVFLDTIVIWLLLKYFLDIPLISSMQLFRIIFYTLGICQITNFIVDAIYIVVEKRIEKRKA